MSGRRVRLLPALLALAAAGLAAAPPAAARGGAALPAVDAAVQVTADPAAVRGHATPALAVDPRNRSVLALVEGDAYADKCSVHISTNAGLSWARAADPTVPPGWPGCLFAVTGEIADVTFGPDGTLYDAFVGFNPATYEQRVFLARSRDLGRTWEPTVALPHIARNIGANEMGMDALPSVTVDPNDPAKVYVGFWSNNGAWNLPQSILGGDKKWCNDIVPRAWVTSSTDGGRTFGAAVDAAPDVKGCMTEPYLAVGTHGEVFATFGESARGDPKAAPPAHLYFSVSHDAGRTFSVEPIHTQSAPNDGPAANANSDWLSAPSPAVDPRNGHVYVAWEEMGAGVPQILFTSSTDGGRTWNNPKKLNDVDPRRDWDFPEQFPRVAVAPNGRVDVAWYDWRDDVTYKDGDTENGLQNVYATSSTDGGISWTQNVRVTDRSIDRRFGPRQVGFITGPVGLASTDEAAYVAWDDTRNGNPTSGTQDIYFTRARYAPPDRALASGGSRVSPVLWVLLGAAGALVLGGLALGAVVRWSRRHAHPASPPPPLLTPRSPRSPVPGGTGGERPRQLEDV
ncbi:MAG TPA: sialidase family protein [Acidimicrobiales bacterium]|nr:sialidase family protein [Acidimicrobiales bacterium]